MDNMEVIMERLEKAIEREDDKVLEIVEDIFYRACLDDFVNKTFMNWIWNLPVNGEKNVPFNNASSYVMFINRIYNNYTSGEIDIWKEVLKSLKYDVEMFYPPFVIRQYKRMYERLWKYIAARSIFQELKRNKNPEPLVSYVAPIVEEHVKSGIIDVKGYFYDEYFDDFIKDTKRILELAKEFGVYETLLICLTL